MWLEVNLMKPSTITHFSVLTQIVTLVPKIFEILPELPGVIQLLS